MALKLTARRMDGGQDHEHIRYLWWIDDTGNSVGCFTLQQMIAYIIDKGPGSVWCPSKNPRSEGEWVYINRCRDQTVYVQSWDGVRWSDNLLHLPER
jgi:Protein of unknown function (DUF3892)